MITIRDFCKKYSGLLLRHVLATHHYRAVMEWNDELILKACDECEKLHRFLLAWQQYLAQHPLQETVPPVVLGDRPALDEGAAKLSVIEKMALDLANDFNVAGALGHYFAWMKTVSADLAAGKELTVPEKIAIQQTINFVQAFSGILDDDPAAVLKQIDDWRRTVKGKTSSLSVDPIQVENLIKERQQAKAQKDYAKADQIRAQLDALNIVVQDLPGGKFSWKQKD